MACGVALKRPYDYDDYLIAEGSEVKRARHTQTHCSPFRAQIGTIAASLPASGASSALMQLRDPKVIPFYCFYTLVHYCSLDYSFMWALMKDYIIRLLSYSRYE